MTLQALLNIIGSIGIEDKLINFAGAGGSVYEINDLTIRDYPILYCSPTGTHRVEDNFTTYSIVLFYIDRLLEDNSNGTNIHSSAVEVLKNIIRKAARLDEVISISDEYTINLFTETEKMKDRCNGAYATVEFTVANDYICADYENGDNEPGSGATTYLRIVSPENNSLVPYTESSVTFEWRTNLNEVIWTLYKNFQFTESGRTADNSVTLDTPNETEQPMPYYFTVEDTGRTMQEWVIFSKEAVKFLTITAPTGDTISSSGETLHFAWEENYQEETKWEMTGEVCGQKVVVASGVTYNGECNIEIPENRPACGPSTYTFKVERNEYGYPSVEKTLTQGEMYYYFDFITPDNQTIPFYQTAFTIEWETNLNLEGIIWQCFNSDYSSIIDRGVLSEGQTSLTATFQENETESARTMNVFFDGKNIRFTQEEKEVPYLNVLTQSGQQVSSATTAFTIEWESNIEGPFEYEYTDQYGTVTGTTGGTAFTATFEENYTDYAIERSFTISGQTVSWTQAEAEEPDWNTEHMTIRASSGGTFILYYTGDPQTQPELDVEFSVNRGEWKSYNQSTESDRTVFAGSRIRVRGNNATYNFGSHKGYVLAMTNDFKVAGNIMSLTYGDNFSGQTALTENNQFSALFERHTPTWGTCVDARDLILPATQLTSGCYESMFLEQTELHGTPKLMAENVPSYAYSYMFNNCRKLEFIYCNATQLGNNATNNWFENASEGDIPCVFYRNPNYVWERGVSGIPLWMTIQSIPEE